MATKKSTPVPHADSPALAQAKKEFLILWTLATSSPGFFIKTAAGRWNMYDKDNKVTRYDPTKPTTASNASPFVQLRWQEEVETFLDTYPDSPNFSGTFTDMQNAFQDAANSALTNAAGTPAAYPDKTVCPKLKEVLGET